VGRVHARRSCPPPKAVASSIWGGGLDYPAALKPPNAKEKGEIAFQERRTLTGWSPPIRSGGNWFQPAPRKPT